MVLFLSLLYFYLASAVCFVLGMSKIILFLVVLVAWTYLYCFNMSCSWNNETIINFIETIRLRVCLWDNTDAEYRNRQLKKDEWKAVATEFGISAEEAQKKFKNLRTYFNNEIKKAEKRQRSGSGASQESNWFAFKTMLFLKDVDDPDPGKDSESQVRISFSLSFDGLLRNTQFLKSMYS